ncbi:MAG: glycosyltransferase family 2 protein, partial [bacterium]|nr:glycosyltransferase family 2 protein [bacterium]
GACNLGAKASVGKILAFVNDDMIIQPGWMSELVRQIQEKEAMCAGGRILNADGSKIDFAGGSVNLIGWGFQAGHGDHVPSEEDEFATLKKIPFACGGNFAIEAEVFEKSGGFDHDYFAYYEDVDLGWRLHLMGEVIMYCEKAVVHHNTGSTGKFLPPATKWFLQERNALQNVFKNYSDEYFAKILPVAIALVGVRAEILSGLDSTDILADKYWRHTILGDDIKVEALGGTGIMHGLLDSVRDSIKTGMKSSRKGTLPDGYLPLENRGAAGLLALEWCLNNWDDLLEKRNKVQSMRIRKDREILPLFDDPLRPVLGHPREVEAMKPLEPVLNELLRG